MAQKVDYIIVGLGLAGAALSIELLRRGKSLMVWDEPTLNKASHEAAGLYNPITGRVMTKTWKAEEIFPFMTAFYRQAEKESHRSFLHAVPIYRPFVSVEERESWKQKSTELTLGNFVSAFHEQPFWTDEVRNPFGGIEIAQSGYLDVKAWLDAVRARLIHLNAYCEEHFEETELENGDEVSYREIHADAIIFCNGLSSKESRWFHWLPIHPLKGETLDVRVHGNLRNIYNRGVFAAPHGSEAFRVGSTYEHEPFLAGPSQKAAEELGQKLGQLLVKPFEILHQSWGIRPTSRDRRPMLGSHPANKKIAIFNGLGTKGVSLAPYFARHLADWLEGSCELSAEVNIYRFKALYSGD